MTDLKTYSPEKTLKTLNLRVSAINNTESGVVEYTLNDIKEKVEGFVDRYTKTKFAYIAHDKDTNADGVVGLHFHIYMHFNRSPVRFKYIKELFPYGKIDEARNNRATVQYLIHKNAPEKFQYDKSEIYTNFTEEELLLHFINDKKMSNIKERDELREVINDICDGRIRKFNYCDFIDRHIYVKHKGEIENAFKFYQDSVMNNPNRNIDVIFITGASGTGKTTIAKQLSNMGDYNGVAVSSGSNDPWQDYNGQDIFILDDLRADVFKKADFLKMTDNHTISSSPSRYNNKFFMGKLLIITSYDDLDRFYPDMKGVEREQLNRRITTIIEVNEDNYTIYKHHKDGTRIPLYVRPNPVKIKYKKTNNNIDDDRKYKDLSYAIIDGLEFDDEIKQNLYNDVIEYSDEDKKLYTKYNITMGTKNKTINLLMWNEMTKESRTREQACDMWDVYIKDALSIGNRLPEELAKSISNLSKKRR